MFVLVMTMYLSTLLHRPSPIARDLVRRLLRPKRNPGVSINLRIIRIIVILVVLSTNNSNTSIGPLEMG